MAGPVISVRDAVVIEPGSNSTRLQFRITLDAVATAPVTIRYAMLDVTASGATDFARDFDLITIPAGQQEVLLPVTVYGDMLAEGSERFSLVLTSAVNGVFAGGAAALVATGVISEGGNTVLNDAVALAGPPPASGAGALPTLDVRNVTVFEGNNNSGPARFLVMLDKVATAPVTFSYYFQDATGSGRSDYANDVDTFTIAAGQQSAFVSATVYGDTFNEGQEAFNLVIGNVLGARPAGDAAALVATATIIDGDDGVTGLQAGIGGFGTKILGPASISPTLPTLTVSSPALIEANNNSASLRYLVTFDRPLTSPVRVDYLVQDGTASAASGITDYGNDTGTASFAVGSQSGWINVTVYGDNAIEANETVRLVLSNVSNAVFDGGAAALVASGTIIDDDGGRPTLAGGVGPAAAQVFGFDEGGALPTLTLVSTSAAEGNSNSERVGVYVLLSKVSAGDVTFRFETLNGTAASGSDYFADTGTFTIPAGRLSGYIPFTVRGDIAIEGDEAFSVRVSNLTGATLAGGATTSTAQVLIRDNDGGGGTAGQPAGPAFEILAGSPGDDVLVGTPGNDNYRGGAGGDRLAGAAGDDRLTGGTGDDRIDGGDGFDVAVFDGFFTLSSAATAAGLTTIAGPEGTDTLSNVERIEFRDGALLFGEGTTGAQIIRMYDSALRRGPDVVGLDYWLDQLEDRGTPLLAIADAFLNSPEFQAATGGLSNADFVDFVYRTTLEREPDPAGRTYWTGQLDGGVTRATMLVQFSESAEHRAGTAGLIASGYFNTNDSYQSIALLYDAFTGRLPDQGGLTFWAEQLKSGARTLQGVADAFAGSPEFAQATQGKTNAQLVDYIYQNVLGRGPDAGGGAYWTGRLDNGLTKGELLLEFSESAEHYAQQQSFIVYGIDVLP